MDGLVNPYFVSQAKAVVCWSLDLLSVRFLAVNYITII